MLNGKATLGQAIGALLGQCDGARMQDGSGFNAYDSPRMHELGRKPVEQWRQDERVWAWLSLRKYSKQLAAHGIDYADIADPRAGAGPTRRVELEGTDLAIYLDYPGDTWLKDGLKDAIRSRFYDANPPRWLVPGAAGPLSDLAGWLAEVQARAPFRVSDAARALLERAEKLPAAAPVGNGRLLRGVGESFLVSWPNQDPRFAELKETVKDLPLRLRRWDGMRRAWEVRAASDDILEALARLAAEHDFTLDEAATAAIGRWQSFIAEGDEWEARSRALAGEHDALSMILSRHGHTMYPYQVAGSHFALDARSCIIADEVGTGKTIMGYATAHVAAAFPLIVVCQQNKREDWVEEAFEWIPDRSVCMIDGGKARVWSADVYVINYDVLHVYVDKLLARNPAMLILDEAQLAKEFTARRTKAVLALSAKIERVIALTGTPIMNHPGELLSMLVMTDRLKHFGGTQEAFKKRYRPAVKAETKDGRSFDVHTKVESPVLVDLHNRLRRTGTMIRRLKADVMPDLPPVLPVKMLPFRIANRPEYAHAEAEFLRWVRERAMSDDAFIANKIKEVERDDEFMARVWALPPLERAARIRAEAVDRREDSAARAEQLVRAEALKAIAARGIVPEVDRWVGRFIADGEKIIVFAHHRDVQEELVAAFPGCARIMGGPEGKRHNQAWKRQFQNDPRCLVIVCSIMAASSGHTLTAACNTLHTEYGWRPGDQTQGIGRAHRIGQHRPVQPWFAFAADTVYADNLELLAEKAVDVDAVTDGKLSEGGGGSVFGDFMARMTVRALAEPGDNSRPVLAN